MKSVLLEPVRPITLLLTTFGTDTFYTQACLESIRQWKAGHHRLIVVVHDETARLRALLEAFSVEGVIDRLIYAIPGHGHTRGVNLAIEYACTDVVFNIANDILIGPEIVDECARLLRSDPQLGLIGWHWYNEGTFWSGETIRSFSLRDRNHQNLSSDEQNIIRTSPWFTGRFFQALGGPWWLQLCNTAFFGIRREVLDRIGGGFGPQFSHYWADDLLSYAVLDQGFDVRSFPERFRRREHFHEYQYDQTDVQDRRRHDDSFHLKLPPLVTSPTLSGGMSESEMAFLHLLAQAIPDNSVVTNVGVWRGASAIVLLHALRGKRIDFHFLDCFDLPGISSMSNQPPIPLHEFVENIRPFVQSGHSVHVHETNTLDLDSFPRSDFLFVDAGHTEKCISHDSLLAQKCMSPRGVAVFHDYNQPVWPSVKPILDSRFEVLEVFETIAVYRKQRLFREQYDWDRWWSKFQRR